MIKPIVHDPLLLAKKSVPATMSDRSVVTDLIDTLLYHRKECVGMAANMIGVHKRIIVVDHAGMVLAMINPEIVSQSGEYEAEEGCLSLAGVRKTRRFDKIRVKFTNAMGATHTQDFSGWTAQIIQHEIDHCNGILI